MSIVNISNPRAELFGIKILKFVEENFAGVSRKHPRSLSHIISYKIVSLFSMNFQKPFSIPFNLICENVRMPCVYVDIGWRQLEVFGDAYVENFHYSNFSFRPSGGC